MKKNLPIEFTISPHNSLGKNSLYIVGFIVFFIFIIFSFIWLSVGAWPITIFMGAEYIALCFLVFLFYKKRKIIENIKIDEKKLSYKYYHEEKLKKEIIFITYWTKIKFWMDDNKSILTISQSEKKIELGALLNSKPKKEIYKELNKYLSN